MEQSPSWEAVNCAATQKLSSILWNPKVQYRFTRDLHWSLSSARSIQSISSRPISLRSISTLPTHLVECLSDKGRKTGRRILVMYLQRAAPRWRPTTQQYTAAARTSQAWLSHPAAWSTCKTGLSTDIWTADRRISAITLKYTGKQEISDLPGFGTLSIVRYS
jgi:hypothetical protein